MSTLADRVKSNREAVAAIILIAGLLLTIFVVYQISTNNPKHHDRGISDIAWNPAHDGFVSVSDQDGRILIWEWDGDDYIVMSSLVDSRFTSGGIQSVEWHPSGDYFAIADLFDGIYFYSDSGDLLQAYEYEKGDRAGENGAVYTIEWSPNGDQLAVMEERGDDDDLEIHIYDTGDVAPTEEIELVDFTSYQIIEDVSTLGSFHNHIRWISQDTIVVGTSGASNSNRGNITTYHLRESGAILEVNQSIGSVYQLEYYSEIGYGMALYSKLENNYDPSDISNAVTYHEVVVFNSTLDVINSFNTSFFGNVYLDPIHKDLVKFANISSEIVGQHLDLDSLEVRSSQSVPEDLYHYRLHFSSINPYFIQLEGNRIEIYNSTNFELFRAYQ